MNEYEMHMLNDDGTPARVTSKFHLDDSDAVLCARAVAKGKDFEVWRGGKRVYPPNTSDDFV